MLREQIAGFRSIDTTPYLRVEALAGRRNKVSLLAGFGAEVMLGRRNALLSEYCLHHVANADTKDRDPGINATQ